MFPIFAKSRFQEEFLALTEKVGYHKPTLFERRVLPLALGGRDLAIEVPEGDDATTAVALAGIAAEDAVPGDFGSIILTAHPESVRNISGRLRLFTSRWNKAAYTVAIGIDDNIKKELQLLSKPPDIIVGTPERLIDHIRRENLSVARVRRVVVDLPDDYAEVGFDKDLLFIYSKLSKKTQTILFTSSLEAGASLSPILKRPQLIEDEPRQDTLIQNERPETSPRSCRVYQTDKVEQKQKLLGEIFFAEEVDNCAVICRNRATADQIVAALAAQGISARRLLSSDSTEERTNCESDLHAKTIRAIVTDSLRRAKQIPALERLIFYEMPSDAESYAELKAQLSQTSPRSLLIALSVKGEPSVFEGTQEVQYVDTSNSPSHEDILKSKIRNIVKRIKEEEDPDELNKLRRIVRRNVPIFLRGYFMAYLIKEASGKQDAAREMKTLFVSIGKNRRVFPRDLSRLFSGTLNIQAGSIGNIKVLDNYSFIDIPEPLADKAISLLDGKDFRGRKITVNHARKKEEE